MAIGGLQFVGAPIELVCQLTQPPAGLVIGKARCKPANMAGAFTETDKIVSGWRPFRHCPAPSCFGLPNMPFAPVILEGGAIRCAWARAFVSLQCEA